MPRPLTTNQIVKAQIITLVICLILMLPIIIYIKTFGAHITNNHSRWAEMGSAMSGIYTPILTVLTLIVLSFQVKLQGQLNEHTFDQSYIQDARSDVHFYLEQLVREVELKLSDDINIRASIINAFGYIPYSELQRSEVVEVAKALDRKHQRLVSMWSAYYCVLTGLKQNQHHPYSVNFTTAKQKAIAMLSYELCAALDNLTWAVSDGKLPYGYEFSRILPQSESST